MSRASHALADDLACVRATASVERYAKRYRRALKAFAARGAHEADLIETFPAACIAIVARRGPPERRGEALWRIAEGRPLKQIADALDLPFWSRRLPANALHDAPPRQMTYEDPGAGLYARISRRMPRDPVGLVRWVRAMFDGFARAPGEFALWAASDAWASRRFRRGCPRALAAYAFYAKAPDTLAGGLIESPWSPRDPGTKSLLAARGWMTDLVFDHALDRSHLARETVKATRFKGFKLKPLISPRDIVREGAKMRHCIGDYWPRVAVGESLLFRITSPAGENVNFEVRQPRAGGGLAITEIKGVANCAPSPKTRAVAADWVAGPLAEAAPRALPLAFNLDPGVWREIWAPYWDAYGDATGVPDAPTTRDLVNLIYEVQG